MNEYRTLENYEMYCDAFRKGLTEAKLLQMLRSWISTRLKNCAEIAPGQSYIGLDQLEPVRSIDTGWDALTYIADTSKEAFSRITVNMREAILRENIQMPLHKVREINNASIIWLCRKPGRTKKEKLANTQSLLAVNRRMTLDTGENRLLKSFSGQMINKIRMKHNALPSEYHHQAEYSFIPRITSFLQNPENQEIRKWENLPPNNTLLSDKNYKVIWSAWNDLQNLDNIIREDSRNLDKRIMKIFFVEFLARMRNFVYLPQIPIDFDYDRFEFDVKYNEIYAYTEMQSQIRIISEPYAIKVCHEHMFHSFCYDRDFLGEVTGYTDIISKAEDAVNQITEIFSISPLQRENKEYTVSGKIYADIFSAVPEMLDKDGSLLNLQYCTLFQEQQYETNHKPYYLSCDKSEILEIRKGISTYSLKSCVESENSHILYQIIRNLSHRVKADSLTMLLNDGYNDFQLRVLRKSVRSFFSDVSLFPESIASVFWYQGTPEFEKRFKSGDTVMVVNLLGDAYSITPVQGFLKTFPDDTQAIVWERYPTEVIKSGLSERVKQELIETDFPEEQAEELLKVSGLRSLKKIGQNIYFHIPDNGIYNLSECLDGLEDIMHIDVTETVRIAMERISRRNKDNTDTSIHILLKSELLSYNGKASYCMGVTAENTLNGCKLHDILSENSQKILWRDHLPNLSIKQLFGEFRLVDNATTIPRFGEKCNIPIKNTITLKKNRPEHHFKLVQNESGTQMQFEAVVRNPAFPLSRDTECRLLMTYQYGADDPYTLKFVPVNADTSEFSVAKVEWKRCEHYDISHLEAPGFPPVLSWEQMRSVPKLNSDETSDLCEWISEGLKFYRDEIQKEKYVVNFNDKNISILNKNPDFIVFEMSYMGEKRKILLNRYSYNNWHEFQENPEIVKFLVSETNPKEVVIDLDDYDDSEWQSNNYGYCCFINDYYYDEIEEYIDIRLFDSNFLIPEEFNPYVRRVKFKLFYNNKRDYYYGRDITTDFSMLYAVQASKSNTESQYDFFTKRKILYPLHMVYTNSRTTKDNECPAKLRTIVSETASQMTSWYEMLSQNKADGEAKHILFQIMCLMHNEIGSGFYRIAMQAVEDYKQDSRKKLQDKIGYALDDCTTNEQQDLLNSILRLPPRKILCILSKSAWKHERFIFNMPRTAVIYLFNTAINELNQYYILNSGKHLKLPDLGSYLEFILAVFRLRELNDPELNTMLSLNNPRLQQLYECSEKIAGQNQNLRTFLKFDIRKSEDYKDIPDIVYAVICYITGEMGEGDIVISGLNE